MNKVGVLLIALLFSITVKAQVDTTTHIGTWKSKNEDFKSMTFDSLGYLYISSNDMGNVGGPSYMQDGNKFSLQYRVNYKTTPYELDWIFTEIKTKRQMVLKGIFEMQDKNTMRLRLNLDDENTRPTNFKGKDAEDETVVLTRVPH